jgi:condensin complex subunit 2
MYEKINDIIQLSSENKITTKNAWSLGVNIDSIMETALDEGIEDKENAPATKDGEAPMRRRRSGGFARAGVNFQKASCKLDASVKIYSVRVDDTHATSFRILENLTRSGQGGAAVPVDQGSDAPSGNATVGTKATSNRFGVAKTLEKDPSALNGPPAKELEVDPGFHKVGHDPRTHARTHTHILTLSILLKLPRLRGRPVRLDSLVADELAYLCLSFGSMSLGHSF